MSICINNDLIWLAIPKCASMSIENAIMNNSELTYQHIVDVDPNFKNLKDKHMHVNVFLLKYYFGDLETVCIKRDWFERWLSSFEYIWKIIKLNNLTPRYDFSEINNKFIYELFNDNFLNELYNINSDDYDYKLDLYSIFIKENIKNNNVKNEKLFSGLLTLCSQNIWTDNERCTYEFNITEIHKFEEFISNRYNIKFKIPHVNKNEKLKNNNIIINDELKNFVWNKFETRFIKNKILI